MLSRLLLLSFFSILSVLSSKIDDLMHLRPLNIQVWIFDHQVPCDLAYLWNKLFSPRLYVSATISSKAHRNNFKCVKLISFDFLIDDLVEIGAGSHPSISFFFASIKINTWDWNEKKIEICLNISRLLTKGVSCRSTDAWQLKSLFNPTLRNNFETFKMLSSRRQTKKRETFGLSQTLSQTGNSFKKLFIASVHI